jgi:DNA-binding response OmpR family regulator
MEVSPMPMAKPRILIIEDERGLTDVLTYNLQREGYETVVAHDGQEGLRKAQTNPPDLILLDLMLPGMDGLEVCRQLRARRDLPVLMLTARGDTMDRVVGLELGADDYLPKPFEPRELLARLKAILRRGHAKARSSLLQFGRLEIDRDARTVRIAGTDKTLTSQQFALLVALAENAGRVLSRDALMDAVKGEKIEAFDRSIDVHVSRIRAAIEDDPKKPRRIITVRGAGYVFAKQQS